MTAPPVMSPDGVHIHEDHKRFVVVCSGRRGAERLVPREWQGVPVVRRMGKAGAK